MLRSLVVMVIGVALFGCDRAPEAPPRPDAGPSKAIVEITPITQLPPNRTVHSAVDSLGNAFYTVELDSGRDVVVVVGASSIPRATQLSSENILAAMGETVGGSGSIQDLATGPDGSILFYFVGGKGRTIRACIGQFSVRGEMIRVLFSTPALMQVSQLDESISLARGTLLVVGAQFELFLRHSDAWALLAFDPRDPGAGTDLHLTRAMDKVESDDSSGHQSLNLTDPRYEISAGPAGSLLVMDRTVGQLWQVDPSGHATLRNSFVGLPSDLSLPLVTGPDRLLIFAADSDPIIANISDVMSSHRPAVAFPALLEFNGKEITAIGRDDLRVPSGFPAYAMHIHQLVSSSDGTMIGYDLSSGQLMRLRRTTVRE